MAAWLPRWKKSRNNKARRFRPSVERLEHRWLFNASLDMLNQNPVVVGQSNTLTLADLVFNVGQASNYGAVISWGDGSTSAGTVVADGSGLATITGAHSYSKVGGFQVGVTVSGDNLHFTGNTSILVQAPTLTGEFLPFTAVEGTPNQYTLAGVTDRNPNANITAWIDWGTGVVSPAIVSGNPSSGFAITGAYTYSEDTQGTYPVKVSIQDTNSGGNLVLSGLALDQAYFRGL